MDIIINEDRNYNTNKLYIDLIPDNNCYKEFLLYKDDNYKWGEIVKYVFNRTNNICECCNRNTKKLNIHERWYYNTKINKQSLKRLIVLCKKCYNVTRYDLVKNKTKVKLYYKKNVI